MGLFSWLVGEVKGKLTIVIEHLLPALDRIQLITATITAMVGNAMSVLLNITTILANTVTLLTASLVQFACTVLTWLDKVFTWVMFFCLLVLVLLAYHYHPIPKCDDLPCLYDYMSNYLAHGAGFVLSFVLVFSVLHQLKPSQHFISGPAVHQLTATSILLALSAVFLMFVRHGLEERALLTASLALLFGLGSSHTLSIDVTPLHRHATYLSLNLRGFIPIRVQLGSMICCAAALAALYLQRQGTVPSSTIVPSSIAVGLDIVSLGSLWLFIDGVTQVCFCLFALLVYPWWFRAVVRANTTHGPMGIKLHTHALLVSMHIPLLLIRLYSTNATLKNCVSYGSYAYTAFVIQQVLHIDQWRVVLRVAGQSLVLAVVGVLIYTFHGQAGATAAFFHPVDATRMPAFIGYSVLSLLTCLALVESIFP